MNHQFDPRQRKRSLKTYLIIAVILFPFIILALIFEYHLEVPIISFLVDQWFNTLTIILAVGSIILSVVLYSKSQRVRLPCVALRCARVGLEKDFPEVRIVHEVYYKGEKVQTATMSKIAFWNGGKEIIESEDMVKPIRITAKQGFQILDYTVKYVSDETINVNVSIKDGKIEINFDYLDYGDGIVIKVLHTGRDENDFLIEGKIKGSKRILFPDTSTPPSNFLGKSDYYYHDFR
jgi:hypothetical protein